MKPLFTVLALLFAFSVASAGTVTLSGSCSTNTINATANYASFYLINSGNETATNLLVVPDFGGASTTNKSVSFQSISPGQEISPRFYFYNFSTPGSYSGSFTVEYAQGQQTFFALFPCVLSFLNATHSLASITSVNRTGNVISVSIADLGQSPINANVSLLLPVEFQSYPSNRSVALSSGEMKTVVFTVSYPQISGASYAAAAALSYVQGGMHFSTVQSYTISFAAGQSASSPPVYLPYIFGAVVIIIIVGLIIVSLVRKRKAGERGTKHDDADVK